MNVRTLLHITRPRFWLYLAGTFLVGAVAASSTLEQFASWQTLALFVYFLLPANLFLYGINDLADRDTDKHNAKKGMKEHLLAAREAGALRVWVWLSAFVSVGVAGVFAFRGLWLASILTLVFLALSAAYSAPPLRLKARPFFDSASNVLYVLPGLIGYAALTQALPSLWLVFGFACWAAAMHLFSAIPDIRADTKARLVTSATMLGRLGALTMCALLWTAFAVLVMLFSGAGVLFSPALVYPVIALALLFADERRVEEVYWWFPLLNGLLGFLAFVTLALMHLPLAALLGAY
jgi:4-hydroxybenzoate polyprenyltransferase